ncbi:MAG TPA: citrate synthase/methylcitrate synthase [Aliidongia sp.]|uniref:citrate synthase/methylcitrate synthase n=1 Tax=Aliidongia sp. TaxID=1914230 RepID=UPI002DDD7FC1|nr:citrate synthase/methylcitrate synthase [Aliidongia sp.]HEV2675440.1 citrate synthase/methylcitrate synthase [Aliidongia sp.]
MSAASDGLEGIVAAETVLSHVDGEQGRLIFRGYDIEQLAGDTSQEALAALLWDGFADGDPASIGKALGAARAVAFEIAQPLLVPARSLTAIEGLRLLLAALPDASDLPHHVLATAAMPVFVAALARDGLGQAVLPPDPALSQAADFLRMLRGEPAEPEHVTALETYLVTVADHGLNASTFTARVVASTQAGVFSSVVAGLCALKGPLHGGAPGPVLDMLDAIGSEDRIEPWLERTISQGDRLMGFGHRVYRVRDPRADVLKGVALGLRGGTNRIRFAEAVEAGALKVLARLKPGRRIDTNVEFYTALVLEALALPRDLFTPVFAIGRVVGWTAHILEQTQGGRIIRPQSAYVGPMPKAAA